MTQTDFFDFLKSYFGQRNILTIPVELLRKFDGDYQTALFLSQLIYWSNKTNDLNGWIYKSYKDWEDELFIKEKKARSIKEKLEKLNIIKTRKMKVKGAPVIHYKLNEEYLIAFLTNSAVTVSNNDDIITDEKENTGNVENNQNDEMETAQKENGNRPKGEWKLPKRRMETAQKENGNRQNGGMETVKMAGSLNTNITCINYLHKLLHPHQSKYDYEDDAEFKNLKIKFENTAEEIYNLFCAKKICAFNNFQKFFNIEFIQGLNELRENYFFSEITEKNDLSNLEIDFDKILMACKNYADVLELQKTGKTWWKTRLSFPVFCKKSIYKFLEPVFDIKEFQVDSKNETISEGDENEKLPF